MCNGCKLFGWSAPNCICHSFFVSLFFSFFFSASASTRGIEGRNKEETTTKLTEISPVLFFYPAIIFDSPMSIIERPNLRIICSW